MTSVIWEEITNSQSEHLGFDAIISVSGLLQNFPNFLHWIFRFAQVNFTNRKLFVWPAAFFICSVFYYVSPKDGTAPWWWKKGPSSTQTCGQTRAMKIYALPPSMHACMCSRWGDVEEKRLSDDEDAIFLAPFVRSEEPVFASERNSPWTVDVTSSCIHLEDCRHRPSFQSARFPPLWRVRLMVRAVAVLSFKTKIMPRSRDLYCVTVSIARQFYPIVELWGTHISILGQFPSFGKNVFKAQNTKEHFFIFTQLIFTWFCLKIVISLFYWFTDI